MFWCECNTYATSQEMTVFGVVACFGAVFVDLRQRKEKCGQIL